MNRDMDVIRKIILASKDADGEISSVNGIDQETFGFHVQLLEEAGLVKCSLEMGSDSRIPRPSVAIVWRLTWDGFDFADSIADDTIWNKAKKNVIKPSASWTFGILLEYLKVEIRSKIPGL